MLSVLLWSGRAVGKVARQPFSGQRMISGKLHQIQSRLWVTRLVGDVVELHSLGEVPLDAIALLVAQCQIVVRIWVPRLVGDS